MKIEKRACKEYQDHCQVNRIKLTVHLFCYMMISGSEPAKREWKAVKKEE